MHIDAFETEVARLLQPHDLPLRRRTQRPAIPGDTYIYYDVGQLYSIVIGVRNTDEVGNVTVSEKESNDVLYAGQDPSPREMADLILSHFATHAPPPALARLRARGPPERRPSPSAARA